MFPMSGQISLSDTLLYDSPGENHLTTSPTRVFPDLQQILDNNTNADTGACPTGPIAPPVPQAVKECFAEFLPTRDYVGFAGANASPLSLHFRLTARDGKGGDEQRRHDAAARGRHRPVPRHLAEHRPSTWRPARRRRSPGTWRARTPRRSARRT